MVEQKSNYRTALRKFGKFLILMGSEREGLTGRSLEPIPPGKLKRIVVELDAAESEARGSYTLKLWAEEAGAGGVTLDGVMFP